jgi:hypothetical protein
MFGNRRSERPRGHTITFRYSINLFRKTTKCLALLILPGIASWRRSSGSTKGKFSKHKRLSVASQHYLDSPESRLLGAARFTLTKPLAKLRYSFSNFLRSPNSISSTFRPIFSALLAARFKISSFISLLSDSVHTLSML